MSIHIKMSDITTRKASCVLITDDIEVVMTQGNPDLG